MTMTMTSGERDTSDAIIWVNDDKIEATQQNVANDLEPRDEEQTTTKTTTNEVEPTEGATKNFGMELAVNQAEKMLCERSISLACGDSELYKSAPSPLPPTKQPLIVTERKLLSVCVCVCCAMIILFSRL